jgi:hypothetical protein
VFVACGGHAMHETDCMLFGCLTFFLQPFNDEAERIYISTPHEKVGRK